MLLITKEDIPGISNKTLNESGILPFFEIKTDVILEDFRSHDRIITINEDIGTELRKAFDQVCVIMFTAEPNDHFKDIITSIPKDSVMVGIREWDESVYRQIQTKKVTTYMMDEIVMEGINEVIDAVMAVSRKYDAVFVMVDLSVLDPIYTPGSERIIPGGMSSRELLYFLKRLGKLKNLRLLQIIGYNNKKDVNKLSSSLTAKIVREMC